MKFYITAAIPYVNAKPHLGHALEFIQGDVFARYHRQKGDETFYLTGADENSLKNVQAAEKLGASTQSLCDTNTDAFLALIDSANIQLDNFQRSSSAKHHASSQDLWRRCQASDDIYKKTYKGLYCVGCEVFYTSDELDEKGECFEHPGKPLDVVEEENYFFRLSKYQEQLIKLIETDEYKITPETKKNEALGFLRQGLEDISISRSKERAKGWGVPVPEDEEQFMYVWFDALNVYRSGAPDYWPAQMHLIGKGILRFHAIYWPAILLSANLPLPKELLVHGYITINNQKMSKTLGNVIDPMELIEKYGTDPVRYYLLREIPTDADGDFSEDKFIARFNADLANGIGNFASRVLTLAEKLTLITQAPTAQVKEKIQETKKTVQEKIESRKLHDALANIWELISFGDGYINQHAPWKMETDSEEQTEVLSNCVHILLETTRLLTPFLPDTAEALHKNIKSDPEGNIAQVKKPSTPLFQRL
ncbi:MAG: methionine--tRNA ligase [Candidatus Harrisonbacteria bacterium CG10_big_fil_rev_8_21_14_0_10_45_28]|uniref:Methionine--tRNA ligase n=1 Tax=Candidatus Harrisonbacteria bacterium CG10_big_fil_rev_8_21_14_0_10_45_28 TaxID=1974586 RepID=A0A2H0UNK8_9BACT|nr:MAG: methionine--tRNA ligase [Candidatus Harrisonbacteria bacterium CG10_big_fil_rev_8_21_14_0_10_45_28]